MAKKKTSRKPEKYSENTRLELNPHTNVKAYSPTERLLNKEYIGKAILECLQNNDPEGVMEVITAYLETFNKTKFAHTASISRATMYNSFKYKNPTLRTLAKIVSIHSDDLTAKK